MRQAYLEHVLGKQAGLLDSRRLTERRIRDHFGGIFFSMLLLVRGRGTTCVNDVVW